jgi:hypothetical protein
VNVNQAVDYYRYVGKFWSLVGSQNLLPGVQQNQAHIMTNQRHNLSYGISSEYKGVQECYFDTLNPSYKACNIVYVGGRPLQVDTNTNYIGAAVAPDSATRIVWWTTVGANGGGGHFNYLFNDGWVSRERSGLWRGPNRHHISGYTNFGYMYGQLVDAYRFHGAAQLFVGVYPSGTFQSTAVDITLGQPHVLQPLWSTPTDYNAGLRLDTAEDSVINNDNTAQHILARSFTGKVGYVYRTVGSQNSPVTQYFEGVYRGRIHRNSEHLSLILASITTNEVYIRRVPIAQAEKAVDWSKVPATKLQVGDSQLGGITGIYIEGPQTQSTKSSGLHFAVTGGGNQQN